MAWLVKWLGFENAGKQGSKRKWRTIDTTQRKIDSFFRPAVTRASSSTKSVATTADTGRTLIVVGTYNIGKERVWCTLAKELQCRVHCQPAKLAMVKSLGIGELTDVVVGDATQQVHTLSMQDLRGDLLGEYLAKCKQHGFTRVVAVKPTGWTHNEKGQQGKTLLTLEHVSKDHRIVVVGAPYSEHSSYTELEQFCRSLHRLDTSARRMAIVPTVNLREMDAMRVHFAKWARNERFCQQVDKSSSNK